MKQLVARTAGSTPTRRVFYSRRRDVQVRTGDQLDPADPNSFVFFTDNASRRLQLRPRVEPALADQRAMGRRAARSACCARAISTTTRATSMLPDREQAHAPKYQAALSAGWHHPARLERARGRVRARRVLLRRAAERHALERLRAHEPAGRATRPSAGPRISGAATCSTRRTPCAASSSATSRRTSPNKLYIQRGDPRQVGVTFHYSFR